MDRTWLELLVGPAGTGPPSYHPDYDQVFDWITRPRRRSPDKVEREGKIVLVEKKLIDVETPKGLDVYHTLKVTLGVRALRHADGTVRKVTCTDAWQDRPDWLDKGTHLMELEIELPASFFGYIPKAKGRIESRIAEDFEALITVLEDD